jgi:hypothetical protein
MKTRIKAARACVPAWFVGVLVTTAFGAAWDFINAYGTGVAANPGLLPLLLILGLLLTSPALLVSMALAFGFAEWVTSHPLAFGALAGSLGPCVFLFLGADTESLLTAVVFATPGIVAAILAFRRLIRESHSEV